MLFLQLYVINCEDKQYTITTSSIEFKEIHVIRYLSFLVL